MLKYNKFAILYLTALICTTLVRPADAGVKKFVQDTFNKVKSLFKCDSHENEDEHNAATPDRDTRIETLEGTEVEDTLPDPDDDIIPKIDQSTSTTTDSSPLIDLRTADEDFVVTTPVGGIVFEPRILIDLPTNCPDGQKLGPGNKCRQVL